MNYSAVKTSACTYLGFYGALDNASYDLLDGCLDEILKIHRFRHIEKYYAKAPEFLNKQPYTDYLSGAEGLYLCRSGYSRAPSHVYRYAARRRV